MPDRSLWSPWQMLIALLATGLGLVVLAGLLITLAGPVGVTDFEVYRGGADYLLTGRGLYNYTIEGPLGTPMPFTYPPFAALLFVPTTWVTLRTGFLVWTAVQLVLAVVLAALMIRTSPARRLRRSTEGAVIWALCSLAIMLGTPTYQGLAIGQVSLAIVTLVVVDATMLPPRLRGVLVGIAGAIKLLPLIFVPYYLITRQWRAALNASATAAGATLLGLVVLPQESVQYWTRLVFDTTRVGEADVIRNKSLLGLLSHWGIGGGGQRALWLVLALAIAAVAFWRASRHHRDGDELAAILVVGILSGVVNPISWPHHLVWLTLAGLYLALRPGWTQWVGMALLIGFLLGSPLMGYESDVPVWSLVLGDLAGVVMILFAVLGLPRSASAGAPFPPSDADG